MIAQKQRKPEHVYLTTENQIGNLVQGDLVSLELYSFLQKSRHLNTFDAIYEGAIMTKFGRDRDGTHHNRKGYAFMNLSDFLYRQKKGYAPWIDSYRLNKDRVGRSIWVEEGRIVVDNGFLSDEDGKGLPHRFIKETYSLNYNSQEDIAKKIKLLKRGERLYRRFYTWSNVVHVDENRTPIRIEKNKFWDGK